MNLARHLRIWFLLLALALLNACSVSATPTPALTPVTVQLQWTHQAQFAGFYAAAQNGYYAAEGLDVKFLEGGPQVNNLKAVLEGQAQFGTAGADELLVARSQDKPLRSLAVIYRRSPVVFVTLANSGITRPQHFAGKAVRVTSNLVVPLHAMTTRVGVTPDQYTEVTSLPSDVELFASGEVPVWGMYLIGLAVSIRQAGYAVNIIYPDDYGVHFYADALYTTDALVASQPELITRFLRATLKGWTYAVENPTKVGALVKLYMPQADVELENARMLASLPLVNTGEDKIGWMRAEQWEAMNETLRVQKVLTEPQEVTQVYTMQFLREIYGK